MAHISRLCALFTAAILLGTAFSPAPTQAQDAPFITIWDTEEGGVGEDDQIRIPGEGTDYAVEWQEVGDTSNSGSESVSSGDTTLTLPNPGVYRVKISGGFTRIRFGVVSTRSGKIIQVNQWGDIQWSTMEEAFENTSNLRLKARDTPDLSEVGSFAKMFQNSSVTADSSSINEWDVSNVTTMRRMFRGADEFNQDIGGWDTGNVESMVRMFKGAASFNQDIEGWDVSNVTDMALMFSGARSFNQDISDWDTGNVNNMFKMFLFASNFNQSLGAWDISNVTYMPRVLESTSLSTKNYDLTLAGWAVQDVSDNLDPEFESSYCDSGPFRTHLAEDFGWFIDDLFLLEGCPKDLFSSEAKEVRENGDFKFENIGSTISFSGVFGSGRVTAARYSDAPANVDGISKENVSHYRLVIAGSGINSFESADIKLAVGEFNGIDQPGDITIYSRPKTGYEEFDSLDTSVDDNGTPKNISDDTLSVTTVGADAPASGFGEFVFASDANPLATRLIGIAPQGVDFGTTAVGDTAAKTVTISSNGEAVLEGSIELSAKEGPYFLQDEVRDFKVEAGNKLEVSIEYSQKELSGIDRDTLQIDHTGDSTDSPVKVPLQGTPTPPEPVGLSAEVEGEQVLISWNAVEVEGLAGYRLYRSTGQSPDTSGAGLTGDLVTETALTDTTATKNRTYRYGVTAVDTAGNESALSAEASVFRYPSQIQAEISRSFGEASGPGDYRLVALPGEAGRPLSDVISGEAGSEWQAYRDDGSEEDFFQKFDGSDSFTFEPGNGFWVTATSALKFEDSISTISLQGDSAATVSLREGWNVISNPTDKSVEWARVRQANGAIQPPFDFRGSTFNKLSPSDSLKSAASGRAYYLFNDSPDRTELLIPYPGSPPSPISKTESRASSTAGQEANLLSLSATPVGSEGPTSTVQVGIQSETSRSVVAPPTRFEAVSLRIKADEKQAGRSGFLMTERRKGDGETFRLQLKSQEGVPVSISANDLGVTEGRSVALIRPSAGKTYRLRADEPVQIGEGQEETALRLAVGTEGYVDKQADQVIPDEVTLTSYPNPVQKQATVEYTLPEQTDVQVALYDVLGRRVATLAEGRKQAGRHEVRLEADGLPSGVYFGRLEAGGETRTQKITVVR
ncbi:surface protein [Salinibacter ruber]|uniref:BspA family leucine-rich repeat surface protein n=1 Tax=Salinibacter ruber TaxID=146919 RepID=UPI002168A1FC|nr:BspA family leucine-rich repeat surface protein [Salinibacter ruber]MCS3755204.1 surface protein [Salinibacter ruber]